MTLPTPTPDAVKEPEEVKNEMRIMDSSGDLRMTWDPDKPDEVESVRQAFNEKIKAGYKAYYVKDKGDKGRMMTTFDKDAEKIILAPQLRGG